MEESLPFPVSVGLLPTAPGSGITASKKGMARSAILGGWDREFAACGERKTSSGKKRQPPGVCLQASIWKEQVCFLPFFSLHQFMVRMPTLQHQSSCFKDPLKDYTHTGFLPTDTGGLCPEGSP